MLSKATLTLALTLGSLLVLCAAPALARAAEPAPSADDDAEDEEGPPQNSHKGQFGLHAQLGAGYRVLFPYNEEYCGELTDNGLEPKSVCTGRSPFFVDFGISYGITHTIELIAELRLGIESDFEGRNGAAGPKALAYSAGARIFADAEGRLKFFLTFEGVVETTDFSKTTMGNSVALGDDADFGVRNVNGLLFDLHRTFGLYAHFGETATFSNWMRFEVSGGIGLQARFP